ncbi:hypothetical protein N9L76_02390 [bacterium]|nr:hypothetical protein [bacterium]
MDGLNAFSAVRRRDWAARFVIRDAPLDAPRAATRGTAAHGTATVADIVEYVRMYQNRKAFEVHDEPPSVAYSHG